MTAGVLPQPPLLASRCLDLWRVGWGWFAVTLLMAPVIGVTPAYLNMVLGAPNPTAALIASVPTMLMMFAIRLVNPFDGPMQEELGWRGFALQLKDWTESALARAVEKNFEISGR